MSKAKELVPESACKRLEELREIASQPDATLESAFFWKNPREARIGCANPRN